MAAGFAFRLPPSDWQRLMGSETITAPNGGVTYSVETAQVARTIDRLSLDATAADGAVMIRATLGEPLAIDGTVPATLHPSTTASVRWLPEIACFVRSPDAMPGDPNAITTQDGAFSTTFCQAAVRDCGLERFVP